MGHVLNDFRLDVLRQRVLRNASLLYALSGRSRLVDALANFQRLSFRRFKLNLQNQKKISFNSRQGLSNNVSGLNTEPKINATAPVQHVQRH